MSGPPSPGPSAERWAAAVLTAFGLAGVVEALKLPIGSLTRPAAGFFPLGLAVALTLVAAALLLRRPAPGPPAAGAAGPEGRGRSGRAAATLLALLAYGFLLEPAGFGLATFGLIAFLFRAVEPQPWPLALGGAAATAVGTHLLFRVGLGVRLPAGPWGF